MAMIVMMMVMTLMMMMTMTMITTTMTWMLSHSFIYLKSSPRSQNKSIHKKRPAGRKTSTQAHNT